MQPGWAWEGQKAAERPVHLGRPGAVMHGCNLHKIETRFINKFSSIMHK